MKTALLGLLAICGLSFWFILGFPYANHNESYIWLPQLNEYNLIQATTQRVALVASPRPLGTATAWLGYRLSGGSIAPVELFNFAGAIAAWLLLLGGVREKRLFALVAAIAGGVLFSGYIYLFHLHGVFYSPVLLVIAACLVLYERGMTTRSMIGLFVLAAVASLYHPFALMLYVAFVIGQVARDRRKLTKAQIWMLAAFAVFSVGAIYVSSKLLVSKSSAEFGEESLQGLIVSFKMLEANTIASAAALLLAVLAVAGIATRLWVKAALVAGVVVLCAALKVAGYPLVFALAAACLLKMLLARRWPVALMIACACVLPVFAGNGSPTYTIFLIMICAAAIAMDSEAVEKRLRVLSPGLAGGIAVLVLALAAMMRAGVSVPMLSTLANPMMAEREKTVQLERIVKWLRASKYKGYDIIFMEDAGNPSATSNALDRSHRPPTTSPCIGFYLAALRGRKWGEGPRAPRLLVTFGGEEYYDGEELYKAPGGVAGPATVYMYGY